MLVTYRRRAVFGFVLMEAQAFFYKAIFFSYGLILTDHYAVPANRIGLYLVPFAAGTFSERSPGPAVRHLRAQAGD